MKSIIYKNIKTEFPLTNKDFEKFLIKNDANPDCIDHFDVRQYLVSKKLDRVAQRKAFEKLEKQFVAEKAKSKLLNKRTYIRKYYLHRQLKKSGFSLLLSQTTKTISIPHNLVHLAIENKYISELQNNHNYGVQTSIV